MLVSLSVSITFSLTLSFSFSFSLSLFIYALMQRDGDRLWQEVFMFRRIICVQRDLKCESESRYHLNCFDARKEAYSQLFGMSLFLRVHLFSGK